MNKVNLIGRLTKEIELKYTQDKMAIAKFTVAVERYTKGEKSADFIPCVAFGKTAELIERFISKGEFIALSGNIKTGSYEREGKTVYTTDVVVENIVSLNPKLSSFLGFRETDTDIPF